MNVAGNAPMPGSMPNSLAPDIQRNPKQQDDSRDSRHCTVSVDITTLFNPGIGVKGEKESEGSWL
jgi:hypothetical protein